jgi:GAF domain-containing protein
MPSESSDLALSLAEAARSINSPRTLEETLDAIVKATRTSVPGFDQVGISITNGDGTGITKAATGPLVWELDRIQYSLREGPCVDTLLGDDVVVAPWLRHDQRWPRWVPEAVTRGVKAQLAVQLFIDDEVVGGLNMYSTETEEVVPEAAQAAQIFATHAAIALGRSRRESQLEEALTTRQKIGMAIGLVMGQYGVDAERAFDFLARVSSTSNIKLRDIADEMIAKAIAKASGEDPQTGP